MANRKAKPYEQQTPPPGTRLNPDIPGPASKFSKPIKAATAAESAQMEGAKQRRKEWEGTAEGSARVTNISQHFQRKTQEAIDTGMYEPRGGPGTKAKQMAPAMIYTSMGLNRDTGIGPSHYDVQLPGLEDPHAAPRPPKLEELSAETRQHIDRSLAMHGTSVEQMTADFGAQYDQGVLRSMKHDQPMYAQDFYAHGEPRKRVDASAKMLGLPQPVHAALNAITSPNTKFSFTSKEGVTSYPNDEAAIHAAKHVMTGKQWNTVTNQTEGDGPNVQGYGSNIRKAAHGIHQFLHEGKELADWRSSPSKSNPEGTPMMGPKTGPYTNSWSDTHPQFAVADIHTGGGGMLPHLGTEKLKNAKGDATKSERELAIEKIPFFHSAADYAVRQAMAQRNLRSVRDSQAGEWGEEQILRSETGNRRGGVRESDAYNKPKGFYTGKTDPKPEVPGQGRLF